MVAAISLNFLIINLPNFVQFKQYKANQDRRVPGVILFKARFLSYILAGEGSLGLGKVKTFLSRPRPRPRHCHPRPKL